MYEGFELKAISSDEIPQALAKVERYRLLNEPRDAESICRDILRADPGHQAAVVMMVLCLTDQFGKGLRVNVAHARELLPRIEDERARAYYSGVVYERWAKSQLNESTPGYVVYDWFVHAMKDYEQAGRLDSSGGDRGGESDGADWKLRWNACARMIRRNEHVRPRPEDEEHDAHLQDDVPV